MEKIDPDKFYSAWEIARKQLLGYKHINTVKKILIAEKEREQLRGVESTLYPVIMKEGLSRRYYVKGRNIIKYLAEREDEDKV